MDGERLAQRTGYLAVFDATTNERIVAINVNDVPFNPNKEADVQGRSDERCVLPPVTRRLSRHLPG